MVKYDEDIEAPLTHAEKYKWNEWVVGQSVFVPNPRPYPVMNSARNYGKRHGIRFKSVTAWADGNQGIRIWRVE